MVDVNFVCLIALNRIVVAIGLGALRGISAQGLLGCQHSQLLLGEADEMVLNVSCALENIQFVLEVVDV